MLKPSHPLIEAITKPLADNAEMKLAAVQILEEKFDSEHPSNSSAIACLEAGDKKKFPALWKILIWSLAVAGLGMAMLSEMPTVRLVTALQNAMFEMPAMPALPDHLTKKERLLLGDPKLDRLTQKRLLFESDPTNPAYFAEFAQEYQYDNNELPPDFLETAARIDPQNSVFLYIQAVHIGGESVDRDSSIKKPKPAPRYVDGIKMRPLPLASKYTIINQAAYEKSLALMKRAAELPRFETYTNTMLVNRARIIPAHNLHSYMHRLLAFYGSNNNVLISFLKISNIMCARAEELSKAGLKDDFIELEKQRSALLRSLAYSKNSALVAELVYNVIASDTAVNFQAAADRLGLVEKAEIYSKQSDGFNAERDRLYIYDNKVKGKFLKERGAILADMSLSMFQSQVASPPPITDSDLKPFRLVEHELLGRFGIIAIALILLPGSLLVYLFRFATVRTIRLIAKRFASLLKISDWIWIIGLGVVLPIALFLLINRVSPLSGRDYGIRNFLFVFPGIHLASLLLSLLLIPAIVTRWRLSKHSAAFGFASRMDLISLPVIGLLLCASIAAYPVLVKFEISRIVLAFIAFPLLIWFCFVFFNGLRILLGKARSRIIQIATAIAVIPAYPIAIIALCFTLPLYIAGEKHWIAQEKLLLIDPDAADLGAYEFKVAAQKRKEINAILGFE